MSWCESWSMHAGGPVPLAGVGCIDGTGCMDDARDRAKPTPCKGPEKQTRYHLGKRGDGLSAQKNERAR